MMNARRTILFVSSLVLVFLLSGWVNIPTVKADVSAITAMTQSYGSIAGQVYEEDGEQATAMEVITGEVTSNVDFALDVGGSISGAVRMELVGQIGGWIGAVDAKWPYAYTGVGRRLAILDISDSTDPYVVGRTEMLPTAAKGIVLDGSHAYIAAGDGGLRVVDVGDPTQPREVSALNTLGEAEGLALDGSYAYVAVGEAGLKVVDISDPIHPTAVGSLDTSGYAVNVAVSGDHAYVADGKGGLRLVDVIDPAHPVDVGGLDAVETVFDVAVHGNYAYLADGDGGLRVIDVSQPVIPKEVGIYHTTGGAIGVAVGASYAYVVEELDYDADLGIEDDADLVIVDVTNPTAPTKTGACSLGGWYVGAAEGWYSYTGEIALANDVACVLSTGGVHSIDISDRTSPTESAFYSVPRDSDAVVVDGNAVFVGCEDVGLTGINSDDPVNPYMVGVRRVPGEDARDVFVRDDIAYTAAGWDGLRIIDISSPPTYAEIGFFDERGWAGGVYVTDTIAYLTTEEGLQIIDVSTPSSPDEIGFYRLSASVEDPDAENVVVLGGMAYVASGSAGLHVVDVSSDPTNPTQVGDCDISGWANGVMLDGSYAYVAAGYGGLRVVDVSNPVNPTEVGWCDTPGYAKDIAVNDSYVYVADREGGLRVADIEDPTNPTEVGHYETPGDAEDVAIRDSYIYVADADYGLCILQVIEEEFSCDAVTEIPCTECEALVALYEASDGDNWGNNTNWLQMTTPSDWYGVTVSEGHVTEVDLWENQLVGTIPSQLGNLTNLVRLDLDDNQLTGTIPPELGNLGNLSYLYMEENQLEGTIPPELGNLTNLTNVRLGWNQLTGTIPIELCNLTNLTYLSLESNQLAGSIPPGLGGLTDLGELDLSYNGLTGAIPVELGNLSNLRSLGLGTNQLTGPLPPELGGLSRLYNLGLGDNHLSGEIPAALGNLSSLRRLWLSGNHLSGSLPDAMFDGQEMTTLRLDHNMLGGEIPSSITTVCTDTAACEDWDLGWNCLTITEVISDYVGARDPDWHKSQQSITDPVGSDVTVSLGGDSSLTFSQVVTSGQTSVTTSPEPPASKPEGFELQGTYYDITTTTDYTGDLKIVLPYDDGGMTIQEEENLTIQHYDDDVAAWADCTEAVNIDTNVITGSVGSLSWFGVGLPSDTTEGYRLLVPLVLKGGNW